MENTFHHITQLLKRLGIILMLYNLCRVLFYLFNHTYFNQSEWTAFISGIRFDLVAIFSINALFILLSLLPFGFRNFPFYQKTLKYLFLITNGIGLLANCVDIIYFRFTLKRTTTDLLKVPGLREDLENLLAQFLLDYWYIVIIWIFIILISYYIYGKTEQAAKKPELNFRYYLSHTLLLIAGLVISIIMIRGGTQGKPAGIITAGRYASAAFVPLVLNTPFTILKTLDADYLETKEFFSEEKALAVYNPVRHYDVSGEFKKLNVVFLIMESFSAEYTGINSLTSYTPFLDSLSHEGLVFTNAFANGKKSIEGIPAILASLPALMNNPFIASSYSGNKITSVASVLKENGYHTTFFHGGNNGTMGFDDFAGLAGFDKYYGRSEYEAEMNNNGADYDGIWGIYDEPFFNFFAQKLENMPQPFFSSFFSLSSHHPYILPEKYKNSLEKGSIEIHQSVRYADLSLKKFFEKASKTPWFNNTLFVITADHTGIPASTFGGSRIGRYHVPIIFFKPGSALKGVNNKIIQHIDIMPSVLHYLNYEKPFFSFGQSVFDTKSKGYAISFMSDAYQLIEDEYAILHNGSLTTAFYNYKHDSLLVTNFVDRPIPEKNNLEIKIKAIIQVYNNALLKNKQTVR